MDKEQEKRLDINLTFMLELHEVVLRIMTEEIDNPVLKQMLKKEFNGWFAQAKKVDKEFRKFIRSSTVCEDPEEAYDSGADYMHDLIKATYGISSSKGWHEAITMVKCIANRENK